MRGLFPLYIRFSFIGIQVVEHVRRILLAQARTVQHHPAVVVDERNAIDAPAVVLTEYHVNALFL